MLNKKRNNFESKYNNKEIIKYILEQLMDSISSNKNIKTITNNLYEINMLNKLLLGKKIYEFNDYFDFESLIETLNECFYVDMSESEYKISELLNLVHNTKNISENELGNIVVSNPMIYVNTFIEANKFTFSYIGEKTTNKVIKILKRKKDN